MRVLLTEGNGLTSRQVATHLDRLGHQVEVLSSDQLCLARFTSHVRHLHRAPRFGDDPLRWLDRALEVYERGGFDLLFPTHEQGIVLAHQAPRLDEIGVLTAVPSFEAYRRVFDKVAAHDTLTDLRIGQPRTVVVRDPSELIACPQLPAFVKEAVGNSSTGVHRADDAEDLAAIAADLATRRAFRDGVVVQRPAAGQFVMVQAIFDDGELVAFHANLRLREGADGSAALKRSVRKPLIREQMATLGRELGWHGALSADVIVEDGKPRWIDVNPRLVEPGNAYRAGVDLVAAYVEVARGNGVGAARTAAGAVDGIPDGDTHQLLMAVLGLAQQGATRGQILREALDGARLRGRYESSVEELLPTQDDRRARLPFAAVTVALLVAPSTSRRFAGGASKHCALGASGWRSLQRSRAEPAGATSR